MTPSGYFFRRSPGRFVIVSLGIIVHCGAVFGQRVLTLDDCIGSALKWNVSVQSAEIAAQRANMASEEIGKSVLPQVALAARASPSPHSNNFGYDPAITDGGQYSAQIEVQEHLFDGGATSLKSHQGQIDVNRTQIERRRGERDLRYEVTIAFVGALESQRELSLQERRLDELSSYLALVKRLALGGGVNYTDVLKTEVAYESAETALRRSAQANTEAKFELAATMGTPEDTAFTVSGSLEVPDSSSIRSTIIALPIDSVYNSDLEIADLNLQRSLLDVDISRSERWPTILLSGDAGLLGSGDNFRLPSNQREPMFGFSVGVAFENILFNWGTTDLRIQQQHLAAEAVRINNEYQRRLLRAELRRLQSQVRNTLDQLSSIHRTVQKADDNFTLTKAQYAGGGTTALEVLSAEQLLSENRLSEIQVRADLMRSLARFEQLRQ